MRQFSVEVISLSILQGLSVIRIWTSIFVFIFLLLIKLWFNWCHLNAFFSQSTLNLLSLPFSSRSHTLVSDKLGFRTSESFSLQLKPSSDFSLHYKLEFPLFKTFRDLNQISHSNQNPSDSYPGICRRFPNRNLRYLLSNCVERKLSSFLDP